MQIGASNVSLPGLLLFVVATGCSSDTAATSKSSDAGKQPTREAAADGASPEGGGKPADGKAPDSAVDAAPPVPGRVVTISDGDVQGFISGGSQRFLKIPY